MNFGNLKIGTRLGLAFGTVLLLLAGIAYISWSSLAATKAQVDKITNENNVRIALANKMQGNINLVARSVRNYILYTDKAERQKEVERIAAARKDFNASSELSLIHISEPTRRTPISYAVFCLKK